MIRRTGEQAIRQLANNDEWSLRRVTNEVKSLAAKTCTINWVNCRNNRHIQDCPGTFQTYDCRTFHSGGIYLANIYIIETEIKICILTYLSSVWLFVNYSIYIRIQSTLQCYHVKAEQKSEPNNCLDQKSNGVGLVAKRITIN